MSYFTRLFAPTVLLVLGSVPVAFASTIDAVYAFGDSLSDAGNIHSVFGIPGPPYSNGRFSNGNVWVQDLANSLNVGPLTASRLGGNDFAYGDAQTGNTPVHTALPIDLLGNFGQLSQFKAVHAVADPNALYTIWIGSNDLASILTGTTPANYASDAAAVVANIDQAVGILAGDGAKNFLVLTVSDLGKTPSAISIGPLAVAAASGLSAAFDMALAPSLGTVASADGVHISVLDTYSLIDGIVANPGRYGFTDVTHPCVTGAVDYLGGTACSSTMAGQDQYLFWDNDHPTAAAHALIADAALASIPEPTSLTLFAAGIGSLLLLRRKLSAR